MDNISRCKNGYLKRKNPCHQWILLDSKLLAFKGQLKVGRVNKNILHAGEKTPGQLFSYLKKEAQFV